MRSPGRQFRNRGLFRWTLLSLIVHGVILTFFQLHLWPKLAKMPPTLYTVTLMPLSLPEPDLARASPPPAQAKKAEPKQIEKTKPIERPIDKPKKDDLVEKVKKPKEKIEKPKEQKDLKQLHEALEEIRKKAALDAIQKQVAQREKERDRPPPPSPSPSPSPPPVVPSPSTPKVSSSTPTPTRKMESILEEYYRLIWAKIKEEWTLPSDLFKERVDSEAIIVIIIERDGRVENAWLEKSSGDSVYDQMAMRAIKKADPLPPFPKELTERTLEVGIRFYPD